MRPGRGAVVTALVAAWIAGAAAQRPESIRFYWTRYWHVPSTPHEYPEAGYVRHGTRKDFGVAFSGGGTRSAAATAGQLRGLVENGWLSRVSYVSAVSGGSWTAVPFTYSRHTLDELLGPSRTPFELGRALVEAEPPPRSLARAVVDSRIVAPGAADALRLLARSRVEELDLPQAGELVARLLGPPIDRLYAGILAQAYITPFVPQGTRYPYALNLDAVNRFKELNPSLSHTEFITAPEDRPFLIVGGSILYMHRAYTYPRIIPVEYTPLYTGVRQEFGGRLGGAYVWPFAYDVAGADLVKGNLVRVRVNAGAPPFTLADVIASSGAAPLLPAFIVGLRAQSFGDRLASAVRSATLVFPTFNHYTVRNAVASPVTERLLHGDGGFADNLGLMPLLARQVRNVIVFVNASEPFDESKQIESLFFPLDQHGLTADRSMNKVFESRHYEELLEGLHDALGRKRAAIFCGDNWEVLPNELYGIAGYAGLNICFVSNHRIGAWEERLPAETRTLLASKDFRNFPWLSTFGQNLPYLIRLKPAQVNLLGHLAAWTLTDPANRRIIESSALGKAVLEPGPEADSPN